MEKPIPELSEVKAAAAAAAGDGGIKAIPYPDLRNLCTVAYAKQKAICKNYACSSLTKSSDVEAAMKRAEECRNHRIAVRTLFERAMGRVKTALQKVEAKDPRKAMLTVVLKKLEDSKRTHDLATDEANKAYLNGYEKLSKIYGKEELAKMKIKKSLT